MKSWKVRLSLVLAMLAMLLAVSIPAVAEDVTFSIECDVDGDGLSGEDIEDLFDNDGDGVTDEDSGLECLETAQEVADALGGEVGDTNFECTEVDDDGDGSVDEEDDDNGLDDDGDGSVDEEVDDCEEGTFSFEVDF